MSVVLVAADDSEYARRAAERAIDAAVERDEALHCLYVVDRRVHGEPCLSTAELSTIDAEDRGHRYVQAVAADARDRGIRVETRVRHGVPEDLSLEFADATDADLLVVGETGVDDDPVGGVGRGIARAAQRDVLVVSDPIGPAT